MDWPAYSQDLNVIEHARDMMKRALQERQPPIQNIRELRQDILEEWDHFKVFKTWLEVEFQFVKCRIHLLVLNLVKLINYVMI